MEEKSMERTEYVGKLLLDYSYYSGEDYYCDGKVEDELLEIVRNNPEAEFPRIIEEKKSWEILYHLSNERRNIIEWIPFEGKKVLEVGSGCGAITGAFAQKAGEVTCVELSKKRSLINAYRNRDYDNVTIKVGNFKDIEPALATDYDYIFLIGVLEYADSYIGGDFPQLDFLRLLKKHMNKDGRLVIAIENKYGLKYFAGCREDHTGRFFDGIENYPEAKGVRTFGINELKSIIRAAGIKKINEYYPYPDYKFMNQLFGKKRMPLAGELTDNIRNFDRDRLLLFDESAAFGGIVAEGRFNVLANSFLLITGGKLSVKYAKYSSDRAPEYAISTQLVKDEEGYRFIKRPICDAGVLHIERLADICSELKRKYEGSGLSINECRITKDGRTQAELEYIEGETISALMDKRLFSKDMEGFYSLFAEYMKRISGNDSVEIYDRDMIFSNIILRDNVWTLIDYEWSDNEPIETRKLAARAVYCYFLEDVKREKKADLSRVMELGGFDERDLDEIRRGEALFQKKVTGGRLALSEIRERIGKAVVRPGKDTMQGAGGRLKIYEDYGNGYSEEASYFVDTAVIYDAEGFETKLSVKPGVKNIRIDPGDEPCIVSADIIEITDKSTGSTKQARIKTNGRKLKGAMYVFGHNDPNINVALGEVRDTDEKIIRVKMHVSRISERLANELIRGKGLFI